jgi:hypothetical protein
VRLSGSADEYARTFVGDGDLAAFRVVREPIRPMIRGTSRSRSTWPSSGRADGSPI